MAGKRRAAGKRKQWKRKPRVRKTVNVNRALQPIAQRYICKMKYSETFNAAAISPYVRLNLNSIFDPNRSGIGHQPYSHDTMATLYNRYRVISCSYVVRALSSTDALRFGALPANEAISWTTMSEFVENPRAKFRHTYPAGKQEVLRGNVYLPSLVGRTKAQYMADDRYQATMGSDPSELAILNIFGQNFVDGNVQIFYTVELTYTVELFDVKNLSQS